MIDIDMSERKYAMTRIRKGDYLWPSNDRSVIWRIRQYTEDGSAEVWTNDGKTRRLLGTYWAIHRYTGRDHDAIDTEEWSEWETWDSLLKTREQAIEAAMKYSEKGLR